MKVTGLILHNGWGLWMGLCNLKSAVVLKTWTGDLLARKKIIGHSKSNKLLDSFMQPGAWPGFFKGGMQCVTPRVLTTLSCREYFDAKQISTKGAFQPCMVLGPGRPCMKLRHDELMHE